MRNILIITLLVTGVALIGFGCSSSSSSVNSDNINIATSLQDSLIVSVDFGFIQIDDPLSGYDGVEVPDSTIGGIFIDPQDKLNDDTYNPDDPKNNDGGN